MIENNFKSSLRESFNKSSLKYEKYALIQKIIGEKLIEFFLNLENNYNVSSPTIGLDLGSGNGMMSSEMLKVMNFKKIHLVDFADKMIEVSKKKINVNNVSFEVNDFEKFKNFQDFNFIFSNLSLHWSEEFNLFFTNIIESMPKNGIFLFSTPSIISLKSKNKTIPQNDLINKFPDLKKCLKALNKKSFFYVHKFFTVKEKFKNLLNFLLNFKKIGVNIKRNRHYENLFSIRRNNSRIDVTYKVNFVFIKKIEN